MCFSFTSLSTRLRVLSSCSLVSALLCFRGRLYRLPPSASWFVVLALEDLEASLVSSVSGLETVPLLSPQRSPRTAAAYLPSKSLLVVMMKLELCCFVEHCACLVFSAFVETGLLLVFHFLAPPPESCVHLLIVQSSLVFHQMHSG